jgi:hypothetical protein
MGQYYSNQNLREVIMGDTKEWVIGNNEETSIVIEKIINELNKKYGSIHGVPERIEKLKQTNTLSEVNALIYEILVIDFAHSKENK